jgi:hypothetical protein
MVYQGKTYVATGLLWAIAFHLMVLVGFLSYKLGEKQIKTNEMVTVELEEIDTRAIEKMIEQKKLESKALGTASEESYQNIASNVSDKLSKEISTEQYIGDVMKDLGIEDLHPKYDNTLPEETTIQTAKEEPKQETRKEKNVRYFGASRVSYDITDKRNVRYIEPPIYKCQGGGTVVVKIVISQTGDVIESKVESSSSSEECLAETALYSVRRSLFESNYDSPKRVEGTVTFMFVAQ